MSEHRPSEHRAHLGRGFGWLGGATVVAKVVDFATVLVLLRFLTKQQVGVASLAVAIGMVIEAFNGLGTSEALIQAPSVTRRQLDSLFWYVVGAAVLVGGLAVCAAPGVQAIYGDPGMAGYLVAVAAKQPLVAGALIPLALMNRDLQYERIAMVNLGATLAGALTRLALAAAGAGSWAIVLGFSASGLYTLLGAMLARPFLPAWRLPAWRVEVAEIAPLARFGLRAAAANVAEQMFKNVDYLLVGWFYGAARLAVYRIAFDVAMEPAMAIGTLVNRTSLPVVARISALGGEMAPTLIWALRRIVVLAAPLALGLLLAAGPLTALLHDGEGRSYAAAATPLQILAAAAVLRVAWQVLPMMLVAAGRPGAAARLSAGIFAFLTCGILVVGVTCPAETGVIAVSGLWLVTYVPLLAWGLAYLRRHWAVRVRALGAALAGPAAGLLALMATFAAARHLVGGTDPLVAIATACVATLATYAGLSALPRPP